MAELGDTMDPVEVRIPGKKIAPPNEAFFFFTDREMAA
jgi:hypothetical protein